MKKRFSGPQIVAKLQHVVAYGVITFLFILSFRTSCSLLSASLLFIAVLTLGTIDELTQPLKSLIVGFRQMNLVKGNLASVLREKN